MDKKDKSITKYIAAELLLNSYKNDLCKSTNELENKRIKSEIKNIEFQLEKLSAKLIETKNKEVA